MKPPVTQLSRRNEVFMLHGIRMLRRFHHIHGARSTHKPQLVRSLQNILLAMSEHFTHTLDSKDWVRQKMSIFQKRIWDETLPSPRSRAVTMPQHAVIPSQSAGPLTSLLTHPSARKTISRFRGLLAFFALFQRRSEFSISQTVETGITTDDKI